MERCYTLDNKLVIPDTIEGLLVTELDTYTLSQTVRRREQPPAKREGEPEMCGEALEELTLPKYLEKVGAYAFYNCFHLKKLSCCSTVRDWGAGVFTGCTQINHLDIRIFPEEKSSFKEILSELRQMLVVDYRDEEGKLLAKLIFPEFFEEGVENTPARILENHVHGSGIRYRNSFVHKKINTLEYDRLFPYAVAWEQERIVLNLALDRILYPVSMTDEAKEKYLIYIKEHIQQAIRLLGEQKAYDSMQRILRKLAPDRAETEKMLETAQSANDSRCVSILMNELQKHGRKQRKAFEL